MNGALPLLPYMPSQRGQAQHYILFIFYPPVSITEGTERLAPFLYALVCQSCYFSTRCRQRESVLSYRQG